MIQKQIQIQGKQKNNNKKNKKQGPFFFFLTANGKNLFRLHTVFMRLPNQNHHYEIKVTQAPVLCSDRVRKPCYASRNRPVKCGRGAMGVPLTLNHKCIQIHENTIGKEKREQTKNNV